MMLMLTDTPVTIKEIRQKHADFFDDMVKIVVDIQQEAIALNAELHADLEELLLDHDSEQQNLWGANIYFENPYDIEFTSLIKIRPGQNNFGMEVEDPAVKAQIQKIVEKLILL